MIDNMFNYVPTIGSVNCDDSVKALKMENATLREQLAESTAKINCYTSDRQDTYKIGHSDQHPSESRFYKIMSIFTAIIIPILSVIPKLINAVAHYNESRASLIGATTKAGFTAA